jgi:hypothetical protein
MTSHLAISTTSQHPPFLQEPSSSLPAPFVPWRAASYRRARSPTYQSVVDNVTPQLLFVKDLGFDNPQCDDPLSERRQRQSVYVDRMLNGDLRNRRLEVGFNVGKLCGVINPERLRTDGPVLLVKAGTFRVTVPFWSDTDRIEVCGTS